MNISTAGVFLFNLNLFLEKEKCYVHLWLIFRDENIIIKKLKLIGIERGAKCVGAQSEFCIQLQYHPFTRWSAKK